jgi:hypothetical protein
VGRRRRCSRGPHVAGRRHRAFNFCAIFLGVKKDIPFFILFRGPPGTDVMIIKIFSPKTGFFDSKQS